MDKRFLGVRLGLGKTFDDDSVCALAVKLDRATGRTYDCRHTFARRVKFANIKDFILGRGIVDGQEDGAGFASLCKYE
jgi:hypothetical protein